MLNKNKTGLALGLFVGFLHLVWSVLLALGLAEPLINFIENLHSVDNFTMLLPFDLGRSIGLILLTALVGYVVGYVFATIWNKVQK